MSLVGRIEDLGLSDIFQILSIGKKTGTLVLKGSRGSAMIVFKNGLVVRAETNDIDRTLGEELTQAGLLKDTVLNLALEVKKKLPSKSVPEILLELGSLHKDTLEKIILDNEISVIENTRSITIPGTLNMKVQRLVDEVWVDFEDIVKNLSLTIEENSVMPLDGIWEQNGGFSSDENGTYIVYAEFIFKEKYTEYGSVRYEEETISDWSEFRIGKEEEACLQSTNWIPHFVQY